jgi:dimethylhistidine N-methyltransferase
MNRAAHNLNSVQSKGSEILEEVISGLNKRPKQLPCKLFYDKKGSDLFEKICNLPEYYLTRTELNIMSDNIDEISSRIGNSCLLVELGSGRSLKTRLLLDNLSDLAAYVPLDISYQHLMESVKLLSNDFPYLKILPICADYTKPFKFPSLNFDWSKIVVFYPGSTIGNFTPKYAKKFLAMIAKRTGKGSGLLIGMDLKKNISVLENAYNDSKGITAKFNLNILSRLNSEISANFQINNWNHKAVYNQKEGRIEMHLVSMTDQSTRLNGTTIKFRSNESIVTEYSYKYSLTEFKMLAQDYYNVEDVWVDKDENFSLQYLTVI